MSIAPSCSPTSYDGLIFNLTTSSVPASYTLFTYGFNATDSSSGIVFVMQGDYVSGSRFFYLDDVSVNRTSINTNILINGDFETGDLTGWIQFCNTNTNCGGSGRAGRISTSGFCSGSACYVDRCDSPGNFDYLMQLFPTVSGEYYVVSFYIRSRVNGGNWTAYVLLY